MQPSRRFRFHPVCAAALVLLCGATRASAPGAVLSTGAAAASAGTAESEWPRLPVRSATLKNGLEVLVVERHTSPTVALYLHFRVGTADEGPGTLGLSHMLEHLLFKGSRHLNTRDYAKEAPLIEAIDRVGEALDDERARGAAERAGRVKLLESQMAALLEKERKLIVKDEVEEILYRAGDSTLNGSTWADATNYFSTLPATRVETWLATFGEQMGDAVLREFYPERDVVMEERRLRVEDDPQGRLLELAAATAFLAHPYRNSDWMSELRRLTRRAAQRHYETYYGANNAVLAVVGDVQFDSVVPLIEKHFGRLPRRAAPPAIRVEEPPQTGERRAVLEFPAEPRLMIAYHIPALSHPDEPALALLGAVLGGHGTATAWESNLMEYPTAPRWSRLYRRLVEGRGVAQEVMLGGYPGDRYPRLFLLAAAPRAPHTLEKLEAAVLEEIDRMVSDPAGADELARARRNLRALYLRQLESYIGTAWMIGYTQGVTGDWRNLERFMDDLQRVRPEDVQRVARAYLSERNRTVVRLVEEEEREEKPGEKAGEPGAALPPGAADAREAAAP
jgi:predicted Zn-dependent peptidase